MLEHAAPNMERLIERLNTMRGSNSSKPLSVIKSLRPVRGTYNLTAEEIERHREEIVRIEAERDECAACSGECHKTGSSQGMIPSITDEGGQFGVCYGVCEHEKRRREQVRIERLFQAAKVPYRYKDTTFADYHVTAANRSAVNAARWMVTAESGGLFLHGVRGAGKTMLAAIIANERAKAGKSVLFSSVPDLLADIKATFGKGGTEEITRAIRTAPMLILDDLGAEKMSSWVGEELFGIVNHRYNECLPTLITSNYGGKELVEHLKDPQTGDSVAGERIVSRIYGMCEPIRMDTVDWRMKEVG